ncbi:MAG: ester cyclase [Verrucomicrobia bacterium]|nr:ester cyclase [Verrucomicrobiota bacterium]
MKPNGTLLIALCAVMASGCATSNPGAVEQNKDLLRRAHAEVWSRGNLAAADELYAPDFVCHFIAGSEWKGIEGLKAEVRRHRASFPDWQEHIEQIVAEGDSVVTRFTSTGTQRGVFNGLPPTGTKVKISELAVHRIANGKIAEQWGCPDVLSLDKRLGIANPAAENKRIIRRYFDEWANRGDTATADELIATNLVLRNPPAVLNSLEAYKKSMAGFHQAFPDLRFTIAEPIADGDKVVVHWTLRGTQSGEYQGRPPTGKAITVTGMSLFRIADGKIQEITVNMDRFGMMEQLGWLPASPPK